MLAHKNNPFTAIIVGGNAAGLSAASKLKRLRPSAKVLVFEKTPQVSYSSCGIPYWIEGTVASEQQLIQLSADDLRQKRHIEVFTHHEVLSIDRRKKQITVRHLTTARELTLGYDKLLLATGARPIVPPWPGNHADNIFTLRSLQDAQHFQQALNADIRRAVVIGAGYVGLEMAAALRKKNYAVTLIEKAPRLLPQYDPT
ncbi:MAG: CoA-disulfide reductase, partial [Calditrichaeota bacterium]